MDNKKYSILIAGDLLPSEENVTLFESGDAEQLFGKDICRIFENADFSIANLEGPLTDVDEKRLKAGPNIKSTKKSVRGIKALGLSALALANNHISDYGEAGYLDTTDVLSGADILSVGTGINEPSLKSYLSVILGDKKVCIYNVSETFMNVPGETVPCVHYYDEYVVCNDLKRLKETYEYIIVIYHGGSEFFQYPTPLLSKRFRRMADSGADFVVSQHSHCIGCEEYYHNSYFLYGQGNFLFARQKVFPELTKEGLLIEIIFENNEVEIKKHYYKIEHGVIRLKESYDFSSFLMRSSQVHNTDMILDEFQKLKVGEIMNKYLIAYKGYYPFRRIMFKLFRRQSLNWLQRSYNSDHILRILHTVMCERRNEDMLYVLKYLLDKSRK